MKTPTAGRVMFTFWDVADRNCTQQLIAEKEIPGDKPCFVLPLTSEAIRAIVLRRAKAIYRIEAKLRGFGRLRLNSNDPYDQRYFEEARATLIADADDKKAMRKMVDAAMKGSRP